MDTTLPPLICHACEKPIWPSDTLVWRTLHDDETGVVIQERTYHDECAPALAEQK